MKHARLVAWGMIISLGISALSIILIIAGQDARALYEMTSIGMMFFTIWAIIILLKIPKE